MEEDFVFVPLKRLLKLVGDPFKNPFWHGDYLFSRELIQEMIEQQKMDSSPWDSGDDPIQNSELEWSPDYHARRVAYLIVNPSQIPIDIDVGILGMTNIDVGILGMTNQPKYLIQDGCHRFSAMVFQNIEEVPITWSGSSSKFKKMFPLVRQPTQEEINSVIDEKKSYQATELKL